MNNLKFRHFGLVLIIISSFLTTAVQARNKSELVDAIASNSGLSKADSKRALESFVSNTTGALKKGDKVALIGFGTFSISNRAARTGRNPQTGATIKITAKYGADSAGQVVVRDDGMTEVSIKVSRGYLQSNNRIVMIPETNDKAIASNMPDEYIFEMPANTRFYKKKKSKRLITLRYVLPTASLTGSVGQDGLSVLFNGADAFLNYLPIMRPDVADTSVAGGDLEDAADSLGFCNDAFVDLDIARDTTHFGHVTVLKIMSGQTGLTLKQLDSFFDAILSMARDSEKSKIKRGHKVSLVGFGSFSISKRAARVGRNPQTGKEIQIKAKNVVKFKAGADLSKKVN